MRIFAYCSAAAMLFLLVSYIWGRTLLRFLKTKQGVCDSILFGFFLLLATYQIPYLPALLLRGTYRSFTIPWICGVGILTIPMAVQLIRTKSLKMPICKASEWITAGFGTAVIIFLCCFISLHPPVYGSDTNYYISSMNDMYYQDELWVRIGTVDTHSGLNSLFSMMTIPSLLFGIRPYYVSLFTMRTLLVSMTLMTAYRTGKVVFCEQTKAISVPSVWMMLMTAALLFFWNSPYQAQFFFRRSNEAKAYCQFILHPLAFSVFLQMFRRDSDRKPFWMLELLLGFSAVAMSTSSMTGYLLLAFVGTAALLVYDRMKGALRTLLWAFLCVTPNLLYTLFYFVSSKEGFIAL